MKWIVNFICLGILCYGIILAAFYFFQEKFLFFPGATPFGQCPEMGESLGTGVATFVASRSDIRGLILISPLFLNETGYCDQTNSHIKTRYYH